MTGARGSPREQNPAYRACTYRDAAFQRHPLFSGRYRNGTDGGSGRSTRGRRRKPGKGKTQKDGRPMRQTDNPMRRTEGAGRSIRGRRRKPGKEKTQKEVADMLGISQSYISRLEKRIIGRLKKEIAKMC